MNPYHMKVVFRINLLVVAYLAAAWYWDRLSWPLAGWTFVFWLLLPYIIVWSWPEHSDHPLWGRTIVGAFLVSAIAAGAFALIALK